VKSGASRRWHRPRKFTRKVLTATSPTLGGGPVSETNRSQLNRGQKSGTAELSLAVSATGKSLKDGGLYKPAPKGPDLTPHRGKKHCEIDKRGEENGEWVKGGAQKGSETKRREDSKRRFKRESREATIPRSERRTASSQTQSSGAKAKKART